MPLIAVRDIKAMVTLRKIGTLLFSSLIFVCACASGSSVIDLNALVPSENWYGIYFDNTKVGYTQARLFWKTDFQKNSLISTSKGVLTISSDKEVINVLELEFTYEFNMANRGELIRKKVVEEFYKVANFDHIGKPSKRQILNKVTTVVKIGPNGQYYLIDKIENGATDHFQMSYLPIVFDNHMFKVTLVQNPLPEAEWTDFKITDIDHLKLELVRYRGRIVERSLVRTTGNSREYFTLELEDSKGKTKISRLNDSGTMLETVNSSDRFEMRLESKHSAKNLHTTIRMHRHKELSIGSALPNLNDISNLRLRILGTSLEQGIVDGPHQTILVRHNESVIVELNRKSINRRKEKEGDRLKYSKSTPNHPSDHASVKAINPLSSGEKQSDADRVKRLVKFVANYIRYEEVDYGMSIPEIIEERRGDCTEYANLFVTLARANGIPAREVGGLIYNVRQDSPAFSKHRWAEVLLGEEWKQVDPSWNEFDINPSHIEFSRDSMAIHTGVNAIKVIGINL